MHDPYQTLLGTLFTRSAMGMRLGLTLMRGLLDELGHPDRAYPYVLVAGTNGKGSTSRLLAGALQAAGLRVGLYTSPHLIQYTERIQCNGQPITQAEVMAFAARIAQAETKLPRPATFFEATTAMACLAFRAWQVDIAVVEVGLGGRLDATNAMDDAGRVLCVITPIALDHQHILGPDRPTIALEKAAILRAGTPAVLAAQQPDARAALARYASEHGVQATWAPEGVSDALDARLPGYLQRNAPTAEAARQALVRQGFVCPPEAMQQARAAFDWPGRYQRLSARRPGGPSYLIDGSHNEAGMQALVAAMALDPEHQGRTLHAVFGVMPHKDREALRALLAPHVAAVWPCAIRAAHAGGAQAPGAAPATLPSAAEVIDALEATLGAQDIIVVVGSLYLAGEALAHLTGRTMDDPVIG